MLETKLLVTASQPHPSGDPDLLVPDVSLRDLPPVLFGRGTVILPDGTARAETEAEHQAFLKSLREKNPPLSQLNFGDGMVRESGGTWRPETEVEKARFHEFISNKVGSGCLS